MATNQPEANAGTATSTYTDLDNTTRISIGSIATPQQYDEPCRENVNVEVRPVNNGWLVTAGCKTFAFSRDDGPFMVEVFKEYLAGKGLSPLLKKILHGRKAKVTTKKPRRKIK